MKREKYMAPAVTVIEFGPELFIATSVANETIQDMGVNTVYEDEFERLIPRREIRIEKTKAAAAFREGNCRFCVRRGMNLCVPKLLFDIIL